MSLTGEQVRNLLNLLALTRDQEVDCDECLRHLAEFAEVTLAGKPVPEGLRLIEEHLAVCGECREEFESLKQALGGEIPPS